MIEQKATKVETGGNYYFVSFVSSVRIRHLFALRSKILSTSVYFLPPVLLSAPRRLWLSSRDETRVRFSPGRYRHIPGLCVH
jgi:hypothetical protein